MAMVIFRIYLFLFILLHIFQFTELMEVLNSMLEQIDRQRRSKMIDEAVDISTSGSEITYNHNYFFGYLICSFLN